jgi:SMC interacting uncharacterized protein involved in chromosome segregation
MNYNGNHKWTAGAGTTITAGIGTALGAASLLNNGGLGGLLGGGNNKMQEVMSENAMLKAEKSTDEKLLARDNQYKNDLERFYGRFEVVAGELSTLKADHQCLQKQLTDYAIHQREIDELQRALLRKDIEGVNKDLNCLAGKVDAGFCGINNRFAGIDATIASFTQTVIPTSAICDTGNNRCCGNQQ